MPDEVYRRAESLARLTSREVRDVLADAITLSLPDVGDADSDEKRIAELSNSEVLELIQLRMPPTQDKRFSKLLDRQQAKGLTEAERTELQALIQLYQEGLLRKARALSEAARRGLQMPVDL